MNSLLLNDYFVISLITLSALMVRSTERFCAIIYFIMSWLALAGVYYLQVPELILEASADPELTSKGFALIICSLSSLFVIALVYAVRQVIGGKLPGLIIWLCLFEIGMHASGYVMLYQGMDAAVYNWAVLGNQFAAIALFASRWRWNHGDNTIPRFLRDHMGSH
jgi:hypothetical protein